jgi:hypothetical protein
MSSGEFSVWSYFDSRARKLGILDTKLAQAAAIMFALTVVKLYPQIMSVSIWWFAGLTVVFAIKPLITFYGGDGKPGTEGR